MVWVFVKPVLRKYNRGRGSLLLDRSVTITKAMPQIQRNLPTTKTVLVIKNLFLSSKTIPPGSESEGDAPRWSMIESKVWNESRMVLNCILWGSLYRLRDHCTLARGRYGLVLATCTVESADGWNALTAVQRYPLRPPPLLQNIVPHK